MREILTAAGLNALLLAAIAGVVWLVRRRQPMTAARLRRETAKSSAAPASVPPLGGDFCRLCAMQEALEDGLPDTRAAAALLLGWAAQGEIRLCKMPKKRLKSFGDEMQATLCFPGDEEHPFVPSGDGAEGLLLGLLYGWADETASLQASEIYNRAREYHAAVSGRLEQLTVQGRHGLRAVGAMQPEKKTRHFGFLDERRALYTPRGVREAAALAGYRAFLAAQAALPAAYWRDAVLLGCAGGVDREQLALAETLAAALVNGAQAGRRVHNV